MKNLLEYLTESEDKSQLEAGIKVEAEHKDLYDYFKKFLKEKNIEMPLSEREMFEMIARVHLKENRQYYELLNKYVEGENK